MVADVQSMLSSVGLHGFNDLAVCMLYETLVQ